MPSSWVGSALRVANCEAKPQPCHVNYYTDTDRTKQDKTNQKQHERKISTKNKKEQKKIPKDNRPKELEKKKRNKRREYERKEIKGVRMKIK